MLQIHRFGVAIDKGSTAWTEGNASHHIVKIHDTFIPRNAVC